MSAVETGVADIRRQSLQEFLDLVLAASRSLSGDAIFQRVIQGCRGRLELSEPDLADKLNVSRPTINRWSHGKNLPHRAVRRAIFDWVSEEIKRRLRDLTLENAFTAYPRVVSGN